MSKIGFLDVLGKLFATTRQKLLEESRKMAEMHMNYLKSNRGLGMERKGKPRAQYAIAEEQEHDIIAGTPVFVRLGDLTAKSEYKREDWTSWYKLNDEYHVEIEKKGCDVIGKGKAEKLNHREAVLVCISETSHPELWAKKVGIAEYN